jgi:hypothetical protein
VNFRKIFIIFLDFLRAIGFVLQEFMIPFLPSSSDAETLENTFRKLTSEKRQVYKYPFIVDFKILVPVYCIRYQAVLRIQLDPDPGGQTWTTK